ncbi:MAG: formylmethanofuran dehydrogenase [Methanosphaera sp.]|nr:formylmethanofuran dehydrogenase [Methanosphaera sp.]
MDQMNVIINSGTSIIQAFYEKKGSTLKDEYRQATAVAFMDKEDMNKLGISNRDKIRVSTKWGSVVVYADISHDGPHKGMIFMPKGPWTNIVISPETYCSNIPTFKGIEATIEKTDEEVQLVADLMRSTYKKYVSDTENLESIGQKPVYKRLDNDA